MSSPGHKAGPYAARVRELLAVDPMRIREFGYHGTSVQAIAHLARSGRMPVGGTSGSDFYVFTAVRGGRVDPEEAEREAASYAGDQLAWVHAAAEHFEIDPQGVLHSCTDFDEGDLDEDERNSLPPRDQILAFHRDHRMDGWRGVVVAITAVDRWDWSCPAGWRRKPAGPGEAVFSHRAGLPIDAIRRITACGVRDREFLEDVLAG